MKKDGIVATDAMIAMYSVMGAISGGLMARNGSTKEPIAPPNGLASDMIAVAETRPAGENHKSEYLVGAARTKGCASPVRI